MTDSAPLRVIVDSYAWIKKGDVAPTLLESLRKKLTLIPEVHGQFGGEEAEDPDPLPLFKENAEWFGMPREWYLARRGDNHEVHYRGLPGDKSTWPGDLVWNGAISLRAEQQAALDSLVTGFHSDPPELGRITEAKPGWGKTIFALAAIHALQVPTLVICHKEFLVEQWLERVHGNPKKTPAVLPTLLNAKVGFAQEDRCDFEGKHIVIGMVHSLGKRVYPKAFYRWPGLVIVDECHRIGARTWSMVPARFPAKHRLGVSATLRRKDGCERVFLDHLGPIRFTATEQRLGVQVRKVDTGYKLVKTAKFNPALASRPLLLTFMISNVARNRTVVRQLAQALAKGRKCLIVSERLEHLDKLEALFRTEWAAGSADPVPSTGFYVGGMSSGERDVSATKRAIFATYQYVSEGLDIPDLDTLFLATPWSDIEQVVGRIQRPHPTKKPPIVVDFRDDEITMFRRNGELRDRYYRKVVTPPGKAA